MPVIHIKLRYFIQKLQIKYLTIIYLLSVPDSDTSGRSKRATWNTCCRYTREASTTCVRKRCCKIFCLKKCCVEYKTTYYWKTSCVTGYTSTFWKKNKNGTTLNNQNFYNRYCKFDHEDSFQGKIKRTSSRLLFVPLYLITKYIAYMHHLKSQRIIL